MFFSVSPTHLETTWARSTFSSSRPSMPVTISADMVLPVPGSPVNSAFTPPWAERLAKPQDSAMRGQARNAEAISRIWCSCASCSTRSSMARRGRIDWTALPLRCRVTVAMAGSTWAATGSGRPLPATRAPAAATEATARSSPPLIRYRAARSARAVPSSWGRAADHMARRSRNPGTGTVSSA